MLSAIRRVLTALILPAALSLAALAANAATDNLLLVTIDTLRADALGVNGSPDGTTPNLDRLARGGVNFTRARAPAPLTLPSHASILTGLDPPDHGVRDNGTFRLAAGEETLAEVLGRHGYDTAAFVASFVLDRRFGLAQGFAHYDDEVAGDPALLERVEAERRGDAVLAAFSRWLAERRGDGPFFAWVHLYDPHAPYEPPEPHRTRYASHPYAGEVAFADEVVGRILAALDAGGLRERTLVAVAGDHGEGLGEHGEATHALFIYNSTLHVPMLLSAPGRVPGGLVVDDLVRLIDLAPTLLDYLGLPADLGRGVSLRSRIGEPARSERPASEPLTAYSESLYGRLNLGWSPLYGLESGSLRYILAPRPEVYDLAADPGETVDLAASRPELAAPLRRELRRRVAADGAAERDRGAAATDPEAAERLRALGYLSGSGPAPASPVAVDPKSQIEVWDRLQLAMAQYGRGAYREAVATLEALLEKEKDLVLLYDYLGAAHLRLEQPERAERVYRLAADRGLATAAMRAELGLLHQRRGRLDLAARELEAALALDPSSVVAHHRLGDVHRLAGRHREAATSYRRALAVNSRYLYSWNGLGMALAAGGADGEALDAFRRAVELAPEGPPGLFNLALQLERMGRLAEALATYRRVSELATGNPALETELERATAAIRRLEKSEPPPP